MTKPVLAYLALSTVLAFLTLGLSIYFLERDCGEPTTEVKHLYSIKNEYRGRAVTTYSPYMSWWGYCYVTVRVETQYGSDRLRTGAEL
jgi:hypothetical protein